MEKKNKWLIWGGGFVLFAVLALLVFVLVSAVERGREPVFDPAPLIGLTKEEVLELAFDQYPKNRLGELNIYVENIRKFGNTSYGHRYYKTPEDAKNDDYLMSSDIWKTNERKKFSISIFQKEKVEVYVFYFENGKVVNVETGIIYRQ